MERCRICGRKLFRNEIKYYGTTCDECEAVFLESYMKSSLVVMYLKCYWKRFVNFLRKVLRKTK